MILEGPQPAVAPVGGRWRGGGWRFRSSGKEELRNGATTASCSKNWPSSFSYTRSGRKRCPQSRDDDGVSWVFPSCGASVGFLTRYDEDLREPLVRRQGSQVSMRVGSHLAHLPPCSPRSTSYRGASRPPMATCPTPGPAPATTAWQPWPPRPSWVSSGCPLLPWESAQRPLATGGGKVRAELQLEGLQPCWTQEFSKRPAPCGTLQDLGVPAPRGGSVAGFS